MTDTVRWGILSTAAIGTEQVIPAIQDASNCEVIAIASRDLSRGRAAADRLRIPRTYGSYEELLADGDIDAIYNPLPNHLHREWSIAAGRAGKHVLCEKPFALSSADAQEMVDVCAAEGVQLMEAFMYRLHPLWAKVLEMVSSGVIGELRSVQTRFAYFNNDRDNIRNRMDTGGGALMDIGCYAINLSRMLFGSEPTRVQASVLRDPDFGTDIVTSALLDFGGGQASFVVSTQTEPDQAVHLLGSTGRIEVEIPFNPPPDRETRIFLTQAENPTAGPDTVTITFPPINQYTVQAELFAQSILDDAPVPTPPEDGVANMRVIERILEAAKG
ncbi:MAG: Gfo/Idh/MocA family oxidoreductase [Acidimicrobiia bacterium]|nr:Gfo/Idh/MocA family oxidoreductase [Acidimicrobiia bacterium]MDH3397523.1 Gfo/Idh/MocA family oxidoreductase [Acidimicrobiia bacterium]MDH5616074.1 Gfo/Idh/MocA family oxidoreductase [Acidimicrobiia bacterium]